MARVKGLGSGLIQALISPLPGARAARRAAPQRPQPRPQGTGVTSLTRKQADAQCERGDDRLAPLEQVAPDEHGRAREGGGGTSCPGARAQLCARAPSPAHAACAQQIHPRPRPVGQVHGLGLVVRADGDARAARQSSTSTPPPRASMAPPPRERFRRPQVWRRGGSHG